MKVNGAASQFVTSLGQIVLLGREVLEESIDRTFSFSKTFELVLEQVLVLGIRSLSLVAVAGMATGSVFALQLGYGLERFGGNLYIPAVVGLAILRELGPVLTGLLLAGRIGSGITAEIASMAVTEQIEAVRALGASPIGTLIVPRIVACAIVFPILTLASDYIAIVSAMIVSHSQFGLDGKFFLSKMLQMTMIIDLGSGLLKSFVFGLCIAFISCWRGLRTTGGTQGVGNATTRVIVLSSIVILITDVFMTKLFISLGFFTGGS